MTEAKTGRDDRLEQRASSCYCYRGARVKGPSSEAFLRPAVENPPGGRAPVVDLSVACGGEGSVARSRHYDFLRSASTACRSGTCRKGGFQLCAGVLVPGTCYPHHPPVLVVTVFALHQNSKAIKGSRRRQFLVNTVRG